MYLGYEFSTKSGSSIGIDDFVIPDDKLAWEGPPQVIELSAAADTVLIY